MIASRGRHLAPGSQRKSAVASKHSDRWWKKGVSPGEQKGEHLVDRRNLWVMLAFGWCQDRVPGTRIPARGPKVERDGITMKRIVLVFLVGLIFLPARSVPAFAAEVAVASPNVDQVRPVRRHVRRVEPRHFLGCPDGYSCYPLYGAYGPYGGQAYWAAYTGWDR